MNHAHNETTSGKSVQNHLELSKREPDEDAQMKYANKIVKSNPQKYHIELLNTKIVSIRKFTFYRSIFYIN